MTPLALDRVLHKDPRVLGIQDQVFLSIILVLSSFVMGVLGLAWGFEGILDGLM